MYSLLLPIEEIQILPLCIEEEKQTPKQGEACLGRKNKEKEGETIIESFVMMREEQQDVIVDDEIKERGGSKVDDLPMG